MSSDQATLRIQRVPSETLFPELSKVPVFAEVKVGNLECLGTVELIEAEAGAEIAPPGTTCDGFYVVLQGEVEVRKEGREGEPLQIFPQTAGESFGEMPLLKGVQSTYELVATAASRLVRFDEEAFWQLMFSCPRVRAAILGNMARRLESYQVNAVHREKLASLGTLAAGLMHELNNPGAAALRAASQLRENLARMHEIGLRFTNKPKSQDQLDCMRSLQQQAMRRDCCVLMGSLEQSDREEALAEWLEQSGVENAWRIAPGLAEMGMDADRLACTRQVFEGQDLSDTLNWLESVISNIQLVSTIESSIARVTDLVVAVKKYAYEGKVGSSLNVHESLHSTLIILGHKLRHKGIVLRKHFASDLPALENAAAGLNQVWTNLLDNAIDASPEGGEITIRTRREGDRILVSFADHGPGISEENQKHIFEPFFTTKPVGSGTGLGLDIARRIIESKHGGEIKVKSGPQGTEFSAYLPINGGETTGGETASEPAVEQTVASAPSRAVSS
ncbi:MAG TPA: ATP-binding protein [Acidobacteriaceae bacterium]|jgi:signal transduction histidine kinase